MKFTECYIELAPYNRIMLSIKTAMAVILPVPDVTPALTKSGTAAKTASSIPI